MTDENRDTRHWAVFDGWSPPADEVTWAVVDEWDTVVNSMLQPARDRVLSLRASWHDALAGVGGDPGVRDWTTFRPLRLDREEDWSNWLAQLIEDSQTGRFAWFLFGKQEGRNSPSDYIAETVEREVSHEGYRADLVITWKSDATYTHIEVKVGDPNLGKTLETARRMALRCGRKRCRSDAILLLPEQEDAWARECELTPDMREHIHVLTWIDVARALRGALRHANREPLHWLAWAFAFCGVIEQTLLRLRHGPVDASWARSLQLHEVRVTERLYALDGGD